MARSTKAKVNMDSIKVALTEVCKARATHEAGIIGLQRSTEETIGKRLAEALQAGLNDTMLDQKHEVRKLMEQTLQESYFMKQAGFAEAHQEYNEDQVAAEKEQVSVLVFAKLHNESSIKAKRPQDCFAEIPKSTRYNFFTAVRAFVKNPKAGLDLWGNKARAAALDNSKKANTGSQGPRHNVTEKHADKVAAKKDAAPIAKTYDLGVTGLIQFLEAFLEKNPKNAVNGLLVEKAQATLQQAKVMTGSKK